MKDFLYRASKEYFFVLITAGITIGIVLMILQVWEHSVAMGVLSWAFLSMTFMCIWIGIQSNNRVYDSIFYMQSEKNELMEENKKLRRDIEILEKEINKQIQDRADLRYGVEK